ncbi:MAG: NUDIX domain-containing protein [Pyrinomonadaceae bacterium]
MKRLIGFVWRAAPKRLKRGGVWLVEPRFMVTAGMVVIDDAGRVLLLKHVFRRGSGWGIPGGFLEKREQPEEAVRRELHEEAGLEVDRLELITARTLKRPQQVELLYRCRVCAGSRAEARSLEIKAAAWFAPDDLPPELGRDQRRLIERALASDARR